eukprot:TRINITY_DN7018_c0_g1_i2.p1 TRINITY_DN7018_c0_g1~~TRINITY_DN7018_c0_g1_i2.p1  ORF type:complete len:143 (+),score=12.58 TRINITY_DN7018_c0_g1_i2:67-495(+)
MKPIAAAQATVAVATALLTIYRCLEQGKYSSRDVFEPSILDRSETLQQFDILCAIVCLFMPAAVAMQEALKAKFNMLRTLLASILVLPSAIVLTLLLAIAVGAPMSEHLSCGCLVWRDLLVSLDANGGVQWPSLAPTRSQQP